MYPILICFGTRPEWLKILPLIKILERTEYKLLFTGQHEDLLKDIDVDYSIKQNTSTNRLDSIVSNCLIQFPNDNFSGVLVQGDTASAFACAIAAFHRSLKIYYLEAGLRSYDFENPYPEEAYRQMISRISDVNFAPTQLSAKNLKREKVKGEVHIVGNTILDNLVEIIDVTYDNIVLVTLHRRENHKIIYDWFSEIEKLAKSYPQYEFILPLHPNPNVRKYSNILNSVKVVDPMVYEDMVNLLKKCLLIITDSGGLQEEGSFLNKKVIVCRKTTERPEGLISGHSYLCKSPNQLKIIFDKLEKNPYISTPCPYGDGNSSKLIKNILNE
jgi:UDP-N-acetylglucosamine 2-epimerase (non-hydrolysing)